MSAVVLISHSKIKEGKLEAFMEMTRMAMPVIEAEKPGTFMQYGYLNEEGTEIHFIHIFPDADAMDAHMVGASERSQRAFEFIETQGFEIYGTPSEEALSALRRVPGADLVVRPLSVAGFLRSKAVPKDRLAD
jgi:quinol monooxygenase YgiN